MTLDELYQQLRTALEGSVDAPTTDRLTAELERYSDTLSWAEGVIDKDGRIVEAFDKLRENALNSFEKTRAPNIAALHDKIAALVLAVMTHDEDIDPSSDYEDPGHDT